MNDLNYLEFFGAVVNAEIMLQINSMAPNLKHVEFWSRFMCNVSQRTD